MGDRLRDYGFMSPFRGNHLSGSNIDQWLVDTATYNKILRDFGVTSTVEFKQPNGSWGTNLPSRPNVYLDRSVGLGNKVDFEQVPTSQVGSIYARNAEQVMPEYRWRMTGDVNGANQALRDAGLQFQNGNAIAGAFIPTTVSGTRVRVPVPNTGIFGSGPQYNNYYINSPDPLGLAGATNRTSENWTNYSVNAVSRSYGILQANGQNLGTQTPTYYVTPGSPYNLDTVGGNVRAQVEGLPSGTTWGGAPFTSEEALSISRALFSDPNFSTFLNDPTRLSSVLQANPDFTRQLQTQINDIAAQYRALDDRGGGLGVIARGLGQVAQFAGMAAGLHGLTAGLGALTSGAGLGGAFNAGMSAAGGLTDFGGVVGNIVGNPAIGNIANVGQAALTGGVEGGLPGALIGAGGATIGAGIGEAGGIGEFLSDPLGSIGGAFNVAAGGGVGGLLNTDNAMANAAQVGPGSLASNTPPVTGPIADEIVTVTASPVTGGAYSGGSYGFLASTLANLGVPAGANLLVNESGNLTGYTLTAPGQAPVVGMVQTTPPDLINGQPAQATQAGGATGGQAQTGGGTGGASAIGGAVTDILGGGTGTSVIGSGTAGTGLAGGIPGTIGVGGAGTTGAGMGGTGTVGTGATGGTGGLLDTSVTPTTPGGTTGTPTGTQPTLTDEELAAILAGGAAGVVAGAAGTGMGTGGTAGTGPVSGVGTVPTGTGPTAGTGTGVTPGTGMTTGTTGTAGGLSDAELAALLTGGAVGVGTGLGGADTGMATATGTGVGTTGAGTGAGGVGTGTGAGGTGGTGDGSGFGNGLDLLFPQMQGLLETGFQPGTEADFGQYGPVGSIIKAGKSNIPQTPKRKKRGIRVNISGRARNA